MKLCVYQFLSSQCKRGVKVGYPLKLSITKQATKTADFNPNVFTRLMSRFEWPTIVLAAQASQLDVPTEMPSDLNEDEELQRKLHHLLFEIDVLEGALVCPESGRVFPISDGIPNMVLNEDEV